VSEHDILLYSVLAFRAARMATGSLRRPSIDQCYFSYGFSVSVSVIVVIYQLQFQLQL